MAGTPRNDGGAPHWLVATTEYDGLTAYTGGIGRHYAALLPALVRQGVAVDLAVLSEDDELVAADVAGGVHLVDRTAMPTHHRPHAIGARARRLRRTYRRRPYDVVFAPEWTGLGSALPPDAPLVTNLATGARLADDVSGLSLRDLPIDTRVSRMVQLAAERRQLQRSAGVIAISAAMLERTAALYPALPPARVVRNCIDVEAVSAAALVAAPPPAWPQGGAPVVLFLGRSERRKGIEDAVAAFARVHAELPEARLVFAGASGDARFEPTRDALRALLPPTARDRMTWLGHVAGDELYGAIARADVAICPSRWEGFGNVALEAKAIGTPLVVTSGSGFDDFCTDGQDCQSVPPADPERLAAAITVALRHPGWARTLAERARTQMAGFAPDPVARDLIDAATELVAPARARSAA